MEKRIVKQGEPFSIAFFRVSLPIIGQHRYEMMKGDILEFTIRRKNREPIVKLTYPGRIIKDVDNTFLVQLTADEMARIPCLLYEMRLSLNLKGDGKEVFTIVNQEMEVVAQ